MFELVDFLWAEEDTVGALDVQQSTLDLTDFK